MNDIVTPSTSQADSAGTTCDDPPRSNTDEVTESTVGNIESRVLERIEGKIRKSQSQTVNVLISVIAERMEPFIERRILEKLATAPSSGLDTEKLKETVTTVIGNTLVESGLLEKFVDRAVESRLEGGHGGAAGAGVEALVAKAIEAKSEQISQAVTAQCLDQLRREVQAIVHKESAATLSSENIKILIDDKFRAISLYLKTDVIPKTVAQILKNTGKPPAR